VGAKQYSLVLLLLFVIFFFLGGGEFQMGSMYKQSHVQPKIQHPQENFQTSLNVEFEK